MTSRSKEEKEAKAAYDAAYYAANRERILARKTAYMAAYYAANREEALARQKAYSKKHNAKQPAVVYRWVLTDGQTAYVGRGTHRRARTHRTKSPWWTPDMTLITQECRDEWHAMELEGRWGGKYRPLYNKEGYRHTSEESRIEDYDPNEGNGYDHSRDHRIPRHGGSAQ